jgi:hypothetical protein
MNDAPIQVRMKVTGVDVAENETLEWNNVEEIRYDKNNKYYTLSFESAKSEVFGGYLKSVSKEK